MSNDQTLALGCRCVSALLTVSTFSSGITVLWPKELPLPFSFVKAHGHKLFCFVSLRCLYFASTSKEGLEGIQLFFLSTFKLLSHHALFYTISTRKLSLSAPPAPWRQSAASFRCLTNFPFQFDFQQFYYGEPHGPHFGSTFKFIVYICVFHI